MALPFLLFGDAFEVWVADLLAQPATPIAVATAIFALLTVDILLPVPSSIVATVAGASLGPIVGALVIAAGLSAGCAVGFLLARRFGPPFCRAAVPAAEFTRLQALFARFGPLLLVLCRPVPVLAEASVLAAGAVGARAGPALLAMSLANLGIGATYATLGSLATDRVSFLAALAASCLVPTAGWAVTRRLRRPSRNA